MCEDWEMGRLLLLFILVPAVELALLIELGRMIGTPGTLAIIVLTGATPTSTVPLISRPVMGRPVSGPW